MSATSLDAVLLAAAFGLDLILGDPRALPHPVRGFGWMVLRIENVWRRVGERIGQRSAGIGFTLTAVAAGTGCVWVLSAGKLFASRFARVPRTRS